ncbi:MAG TPA: hypothetical protein VLT33_19235, partial [Labilithrix sp.]|nr:hypothetical protein [Labilithrix sp.]
MTTTTTTPSTPDRSLEGKSGIADKTASKAESNRRRRALGKNVRRALLALLFAAAAVGAVLAFRPRPVLIDLTRASRGPLVVAVEETGMA